uniref:Protein FAR1-RELATED SEQUENCE n=1 Tax=Setaria italica TaxID=4555 RepID=K3XQ28_SETIT
MNDMRVAVDVRNTEVPERSPRRSEPPQPGERDTIDSCIKVPEMLESSSTRFRTPPTQIGCQQGSNEDRTITTGRQGVVFLPPDTLDANQMIASEEEIPPQTHEASVSTQSIKNVLQNMHGGAELVPITSRDIENRKATNVREEHADDINKLIEFFKDYQDQAMGVAIAKEFPGVVHKICRWHVVNKHMPHLTNLFGMYAKKNFKDKFYSVLNHPLTPVEFEAAWQELLDEFDLQKDGTLDSLYCQRQLYVPAYFKDQYCGRMASTQRSESSNFVMKKCFVNKHTALHRFAKKCLTSCIHSKRLTRSKWPFEIQVSRIYTRNVFKDFEKKMIDCTAFDIEDNPIEGETCYLVTHTNRSSKISWGQHQFKVRANKGNGEFHCECKEWQHTGLFCVHLLRALMRIQLNSIPQHYILRRYTKYAQQELGFDRNDKLLVGADGVTQLYRIKDLTSLAMAAVRSGSMSRAAHIRTREVLAKLDKDNKEIPPDIGPSTTDMHQESPGEYHANDDRLISRVPPTRSKTKGRSIPPSEKKEITLGAKGVKKGTRKCSICGYYATHNARTCPKLQHNKEPLEVLKNRMRGRPRGAQHKRSASQHDSGGEEHNIGRQQDTKKCQENKYIDYESNDEQFRDTDMEG